MKLFGPLGFFGLSLNASVGPLTLHITLFDWRIWHRHNRTDYLGQALTIDHQDWWFGPFRIQYITKEKGDFQKTDIPGSGKLVCEDPQR